MYAMSLIFILASVVSCQTLENGWKGIKPLHSTKNEVDKVWGEPKIDDNGYYRYTTNDAYIQVNYATTPCKENQYNRGKFSVSENTVLGYWINFNGSPEFPTLSSLQLDKTKYEKDTSGDTILVYSYWERDDGIRLTVNETGNLLRVQTMEFRPSKLDQEKFACKN